MKTSNLPSIIISIFSPLSDLTPEHKFNEKGANTMIHQYFFDEWKFNKHILLCTQDNYTESTRYKAFIEEKYKHKVEVVCLNQSTDTLIVEPEIIKNELISILETYKSKYKLYYLINPGFGLLKVVIKDLEQLLELTLLMLSYDHKKSTTPKLLQLSKSHTDFKDQEPLFLTDSLKKVYDKALKIASYDENIVILGETGTGKELLAKFIRNHSSRSDKPFETINCSAMRPELLESRLFGHKKGSFTDAHEDRKGIFEEANGGIVFLDEFGDIDPYMQQALLRFLQFKEIQPIGKKSKKVDVRIIAATNRNLKELIDKKLFRYDLFYRMGIFIELPPFRTFSTNEKLSAINFFIDRKQVDFKKDKKLILSDELKNFLLNYPFYGNFRELDMIIKHLYLFSNSNIADIKDLPPFISSSYSTFTETTSLKDMIKNYCKNIYEQNNRNLSITARKLNISLNTLKKYLNV